MLRETSGCHQEELPDGAERNWEGFSTVQASRETPGVFTGRRGTPEVLQHRGSRGAAGALRGAAKRSRAKLRGTGPAPRPSALLFALLPLFSPARRRHENRAAGLRECWTRGRGSQPNGADETREETWQALRLRSFSTLILWDVGTFDRLPVRQLTRGQKCDVSLNKLRAATASAC